MSSKTMKILTFIATVLIVMSMFTSVVFADVNPGDLIDGMKTTEVTETGTLTTLGGNILGILQVVGVIIGAIILVVLGLKYMMGSLEEKAEYKKTMIPFLVGAIVVMAAPTLARGIFTLIQNLGTTK
jgi:hypothetical protein